jgi:hypothetical protein
MTTITAEQRQAAVEAGDRPVELADPQTGDTYILMRADVYHRMQQSMAVDENDQEHRAWAKLSRKARDDWARENSY